MNSNRGRNLRGNTRNNNRAPFRRNALPRSITANAPFRVGRNSQIVSVPTHPQGLTTQRKIRIIAQPSTANTNTIVAYADVILRFHQEIGEVTVPNSTRTTFSVTKISVFTTAPTPHQVNVRIFDEPRAGASAGTYANVAFFEADDVSSGSGINCVAAIIPKAAAYTVNSLAPVNALILPLCSAYTTIAQTLIIFDIEATFTMKQTQGATSSVFRNVQ